MIIETFDQLFAMMLAALFTFVLLMIAASLAHQLWTRIKGG